MDLQIRDRRCLVTGASAGIGADVVEVLAREGARVVAVARRGDGLNRVVESVIKAGGARPVAIAGDITNKTEIARIVNEAALAAGPIEILVNSAGGGTRPVTIDADDGEWDEAFAINFTAGRRIASALLPAMRRARWGRIINITGILEPLSLNAAVAAKAAFHLWAKGISRDLAPEGVTVNSIGPGRIETEQVMERVHPTEESRKRFVERHIPMGRFGKPRDVANLVAFLASPLADYITGTVIPVDGGMKRASF